MSKKDRKEIVLNNRRTGVNQFENRCDKDDEIEYESYKNQIRRITVSEVNNRIELMEILYKIRTKNFINLMDTKNLMIFLKNSS